jgi:hypothetical protein
VYILIWKELVVSFLKELTWRAEENYEVTELSNIGYVNACQYSYRYVKLLGLEIWPFTPIRLDPVSALYLATFSVFCCIDHQTVEASSCPFWQAALIIRFATLHIYSMIKPKHFNV